MTAKRLRHAEEDALLKILKRNQAGASEASNTADDDAERAEAAILAVEIALVARGVALPSRPPSGTGESLSIRELTWAELERSVEQDQGVSFNDLLTPLELEEAKAELRLLRSEFGSLHELDKTDWMIAGTAGVISALIDIFLVQMPRHPGFLGSAGNKAGPLSNWMRDHLRSYFSPVEQAKLERDNWVPYDASTSHSLSNPIPGLGPRSHRFQSPGHDPLLAFFFGVRDILQGEMTAFGTDGNVIRQSIDVTGRDTVGMSLFEAIGRAFGHLRSDVGTPAGLPPPLMPLLMLVQAGSFGKRAYTVGDIARQMYRSGYDFGHFLAMGIGPMIIEIIVRLSYFAKAVSQGEELTSALPVGGKPKLRTMLFTAHSVAALSNAGKVAIVQNPLAINYPQWAAFFRYFVPQLRSIFLERPELQLAHVQLGLDRDWSRLSDEVDLVVATLAKPPAIIRIG